MIKGRLHKAWALSGKKKKRRAGYGFAGHGDSSKTFFPWSSTPSAVATLTKLPKTKAGPGTMKSGLLQKTEFEST